jgi:hypothetical protein
MRKSTITLSLIAASLLMSACGKKTETVVETDNVTIPESDSTVMANDAAMNGSSEMNAANDMAGAAAMNSGEPMNGAGSNGGENTKPRAAQTGEPMNGAGSNGGENTVPR